MHIQGREVAPAARSALRGVGTVLAMNLIDVHAGGSMSILERTTQRLGIMGEFFEFLWRQKLWWMMPMFGILFLFGLLLVLAQSSALAPFIYTLF
jgi:hypothetical protein